MFCHARRLGEKVDGASASMHPQPMHLEKTVYVAKSKEVAFCYLLGETL